MRKMTARFFAISSGEEKKTALLYALHFAFFLGQCWGALASLTLFLEYWPAEDLALMFIGSAVIMFSVGLVYSSYADRVSNLRLLQFIYLFIAIWLLSVRVLLVTNGGPLGLAYPYYFLLYDLVRDVSVLHMITYTNGFYNTRSAKRAMPIVLSAGLMGNTVGGFTVAWIGQQIGIENIPLLWLATLVISAMLVFILERQYGEKAVATSSADSTKAGAGQATAHSSSLQNLKEGFDYVRSSRLLIWLALASFGLILLINVITFRSNQLVQLHFAGNREGMLQFFGLFTGFSNLAGALIQSLFIGRLITSAGVGFASMVYPAMTMVTVLLLGFFPSFATAIYGLAHVALRRAVFVPIDAILYNCLHPNVKARARAFIHSMIVPLGALAGGLLLLGVRQDWLSAGELTLISVVVGVIYLFAMLRVRREYGLAFTQLLADGEVAFLRSGEDAFQHPDPAAIAALNTRIEASESPETTVFLCEMLYELQGPSSFAQLREIAEQGDAIVQSELIRLLGEDWIGHPTVRAMALQGLQSDHSQVITASAAIFAAMPGIDDDQAVLSEFVRLAAMPDDEVRVVVLPTLLRTGDPAYEQIADDAMDDWLASDASGPQRLLAMNVLAQAGDDALLERLEPYANDTNATVRLQAVRFIGGLAERTNDEATKFTANTLLSSFLLDEDESVQLAAIRQYGRLKSEAAAVVLWQFLHDGHDLVRRAAAEAFPGAMEERLQNALNDEDPLLVESAAFILRSTLGQTRSERNLLDILVKRVGDMQTVQAMYWALQGYRTPQGLLFRTALDNQIREMVDHVHWLLGALSSQDESQTIQRSLRSPSEATRSNAAEALESLTTPQIARDLLPFCSGTEWRANGTNAQRQQGRLTTLQVLRCAWPELTVGKAPPTLSSNLAFFFSHSWHKAMAIHVALAEHRRHSGLDALIAEGEAILDDALTAALQATAGDRAPIVRETCAWAMAQMGSPGRQAEENAMLTIIEKVLFLKDVSLFADMTIDQLRIVAAISEELERGGDEPIVRQGEHGDTLYVIVHGKVAVQAVARSGHRTSIKRLATLGSREYFGEMSIFDSQPFGSDVVTIEPAVLLLVRQAPLLNLLELHPDLGLSLLKVFSLRLRRFMKLAEDRTISKPKELMDLYDTIGG